MNENPEQEKTPEPEKKNNIINFSVDLDDLYNNCPKLPTPANQCGWKSQNEMPQEYLKMNALLQILMFFMSRRCNEGPEVNENSTKRMILVRTLLGVFIDNLNLNGYEKYGILSEILNDTHLAISGRHVMMRIQAQENHLGTDKSKDYTS